LAPTALAPEAGAVNVTAAVFRLLAEAETMAARGRDKRYAGRVAIALASFSSSPPSERRWRRSVGQIGGLDPDTRGIALRLRQHAHDILVLPLGLDYADQLQPREECVVRLAVQKLVNSLVDEDLTIDRAIQALVNKGLPETVQKALDYVRVIGNEAVHPGQMDLRDDRATAERLGASVLGGL